MRRREFVLAGTSIVGATSIGAVAFNEAEVERDVAVDIVADDTAPITLVDGDTDAVTLVDGLLTVDTDTSRADGLNGNGSFTYGDDSDPGDTGTHAFKMTNSGSGDREFTFGLTNFGFAGDESVELRLYDDADTSVGNVTTASDVSNEPLAAEATLYAVLTFDTSGLIKNDDMNGEFTIDADTTTA